jgi:hypothetical protein
MIVKKTKQLGNFKRGINLYLPKKRIVSAAPSAIPVATTTIVNISVPSIGLDGLFTKNTPDAWNGPSSYALQLISEVVWQIILDGETVVVNDLEIQTVNYIPQTGWREPTTITFVS